MLAVEHVITKKNGESAILSVGIAPLIDKDGTFVGGIELLRDITDLKKKERERKNVLSMFAHDMKNSVLIASGFVTRMESGKSGPLTEQQFSELSTVGQELAALEKMIFDFLQFSRFEADEYKPSRAAHDIGDLLKHSIEAVRYEAENKRQTLSFTAPSGSITLNIDTEMLKRAFINLLDNAIKYTPDAGNISVSLHKDPKVIRIQIADTGVGIAPDQLPLIFDAFYRADKTTKGSGLGLFIVKTIVNAHEGWVEAQSSPGHGSVFTITLPL
jgi:two-component system phosphate regulon sensor histidine kinase PhoR